MFPRSITTYSTLSSQPFARLVFVGTILLSLVLIIWSTEAVPTARHLFGSKSGPPPLNRHSPDQYSPGAAAGSASHIGKPSIESLRGWRKPASLKVIGLVFYGRREFVEILDCYLKVIFTFIKMIWRAGSMANMSFAEESRWKWRVTRWSHICSSHRQQGRSWVFGPTC